MPRRWLYTTSRYHIFQNVTIKRHITLRVFMTSLLEYIFTVSIANCVFAYITLLSRFVKERQKCRFGVLTISLGAEGLTNLYIMEWSYHPLLEDKVNIHTKKERTKSKNVWVFFFNNFFFKYTHENVLV